MQRYPPAVDSKAEGKYKKSNWSFYNPNDCFTDIGCTQLSDTYFM